MAEQVGFIGVGIMGLGMCHNLIKAGRSLVVWNRDSSKSQSLAAETDAVGKVEVAASVKEVVEKCTLIYSMLSTIEASEAVFPDLLAALSPGKMIIDCATLTPQRMQWMAAESKAKGALFLEAPVSGSKAPAEAGQLIFLAAGDEAVNIAAAQDLEAMGKATFFLGTEVGAGSQMKIVVNMVMGIQLNAVGEGVALAEACGLPTDKLFDVLNLGAMASPLIKMKGSGMINKEFPPAFPLKHAQKDMRFAVQLGDEKGMALPVCASSNEQYKKARHMGYGDGDFSAIVQACRDS
jgi:3-hydroxyisobutyrate dehydrogenase-like beta-hydroxyacid dehydrogenase|eukprot:TRINITY_DN55879_c0_g1_i1.p1 TRINITY_DN55879_c0_g1~~TRINITY_DN55879_c0_g1_i1.p1  ORF type:complete len:293 (-),score=60.86 TRINITY_DN55879_c0_g1_i1:56-934(-)